MAETRTINLEVKDNAEASAKDFQKLADSIDDVNDGVKDTNKGVEEVGKTADTVTGGMVGKFRGLLSSVKSVISSFGVLKTAIIATGIGALLVAIVAVKNAFTSSEEGQNKFAKLMGVIGTITGNFIDILSDLGMKIVSVFENPKKAIKDFAKLIKENIINRFNGLLELIPALGKAVSELFKGNFKEAGKIATNAAAKVALGVENLTDKINEATEATKAFIKEQQREAKIAAEIANQRAKADKLERSLIVERAEANRTRAELLEKAQQRQNFSVQERIEFLKKASELEEEITNKEIKAASLRRDAIIKENKLSKSNKEALQAEEEAKAKVIELETARLSKQKEVTGQISGLIEQEKALSKASFNEKQRLIDENLAKEKLANEESLKLAREKAEKERKIADDQYDLLQELRNTDQEQEIYELTKSYDAKFELAMGNFELEKELEIAQKEELAEINQKYIDIENEQKAKQLDKERSDNEKRKAEEKAVLDAKYKMTNDTINALIGLNDLFNAKNEKDARRQFKINKALSLAQASIQTFQAVTGALTAGGNPIKLATGAQFIEAGIAAAVGGANIAKIAGTQFEGGGSASAGGSRPSISTSTPESVQPSFNIVGDSGVNQLEALKSQPSKAYVVSGEVSSAQALDRNRQRNATL